MTASAPTLPAVSEPVWSKNTIANVSARILQLPIVQRLSVEIRVDPRGLVEATLKEVCDYHLGGIETQWVNGATLLALLDCVLVTPALLTHPLNRCATREVSVRMLKPVRPYGFRVVGRLASQDRSVVHSTGTVYDAQQRVCAQASGVIAVLGSHREKRQFETSVSTTLGV